MPAGFNPGQNSWGKLVTTHQMAGIIAVLAILFIIGVERGFRGLKIDIS
jgi:hypothetical protein